jgi:hypothetical protein
MLRCVSSSALCWTSSIFLHCHSSMSMGYPTFQTRHFARTSRATCSPQLYPIVLTAVCLTFLPPAAAEIYFTDEPGSCQIIGDPDVYGTLNPPKLLDISSAMIRHWYTTGILPSFHFRCSLHHCQSAGRSERSPRPLQCLQHCSSHQSLAQCSSHSTNRMIHCLLPRCKHPLQR